MLRSGQPIKWIHPGIDWVESGLDQIIAQKSFPQKGFEPIRIDRTRVFEEQLLGLFLREIAMGSPCDGSGMMIQPLGPTERRRTIRGRNYAPFLFMRPTSRLPSTERQITTGKLRGEHLQQARKISGRKSCFIGDISTDLAMRATRQPSGEHLFHRLSGMISQVS